MSDWMPLLYGIFRQFASSALFILSGRSCAEGRTGEAEEAEEAEKEEEEEEDEEEAEEAEKAEEAEVDEEEETEEDEEEAEEEEERCAPAGNGKRNNFFVFIIRWWVG